MKQNLISSHGSVTMHEAEELTSANLMSLSKIRLLQEK